jgi:omega-hydroxy-beta-dihydromenaquinone-9 sulfotransferase
MYVDIGLFAKAEFLTLFRTRFTLRRWSYVLFFTALYWLMWVLVAFGRALDHLFFPDFKRQLVDEPVFIVAPPRSGTTLIQKLLSLDEEQFIHNTLYQTIFPAVTFQRCFDALFWLDKTLGKPLGRLVCWVEKRWFGGWDEMHKMRFNQPEEDDGFFVYTFLTEAIFLLFLHVDELWDAGFHDALTPAKRRKLMSFYRSCLQRRLYAGDPNKMILCKATQSSGAVECLLEAFPDAKFITVVRHPNESIASHVSVFWPAWKAHSPDLKKDGPQSRAYARLAICWFQHLFTFRKKISSRQYYCIDYRDLMRHPEMTVEKLYRHFGWKISQSYRQQLTRANGRQRHFKSKHNYSLEEFGLTKKWIEEELDELIDFYKLNDKSAHSLGPRAPGAFKAPPRHVQQSKADEQEPKAYDGGSYFHPVEALNRDEQGERDVAVARAECDYLARTTITTSEVPAEEE